MFSAEPDVASNVSLSLAPFAFRGAAGMYALKRDCQELTFVFILLASSKAVAFDFPDGSKRFTTSAGHQN